MDRREELGSVTSVLAGARCARSVRNQGLGRWRAVGGAVLLALSALLGACVRPRQFDVVVYGGTAGGVAAAVAAAREGASVVLLEPGRHVGGMVSGGLGATDFGNKEVIGGLSREFFERVGRRYDQPVAWRFEPHVAEQVLDDWLSEAGIEVLWQHRLQSVEIRDRRLTVLRTENGAVIAGRVFLDCSYEGDLMARAGVSYTVGREGQDRYGESLAGVREHSEFHQFAVPVSAKNADGRLLPGVYAGEKGLTGAGDHKVQAYNFRVCLCNRRENQAPFPRPADYDPGRYEILRRYLAERGGDLKLGDVASVIMMPNGKTDVNNNGPISTDHIGASWDYPEADYRRRAEIWNDHVSYVQGFFYFLANDPSVPAGLQEDVNRWGLARDEFVDNNHWPHQLYIREARRMIGQYVTVQQDLQTDRGKPDSIGMGSYNSDSHHVQRIARPDGSLENEGDMQVPVQPYEIAYRSLTPRPSECENLLVPVCVSASHVAYSSLRMEAQYMIMGHAAGVAAAGAVERGCSVQAVPLPWLQDRLRFQGQVLSLPAGSLADHAPQ